MGKPYDWLVFFSFALAMNTNNVNAIRNYEAMGCFSILFHFELYVSIIDKFVFRFKILIFINVFQTKPFETHLAGGVEWLIYDWNV